MEEAAARNQEPPAPKRRSDKSTKRKADSSTADSPRARGHKVTVACEECREKKRKCSGTRPRCDGCIKKGHECIYDQYTWKKGWPVSFIESTNGRIAELEKAQGLETRLASLPSVECQSTAIGDSSYVESSIASSHLPSTALNLESRTQPAAKVPVYTEADSERSFHPHTTPWRSSTSAASLDQHSRFYTSINSHDTGTSFPTPAATLDEHESIAGRESCVDAMGATAGNETSSGSDGRTANSGFFGPSSALGFMQKVQETIRNSTFVPAMNVTETVPFAGPRIPHGGSTQNATKVGFCRNTGALNLENDSTDFLIPTRTEADALVESYFANVSILHPYLHRPTFQERYRKLWTADHVELDQERADSAHARDQYRNGIEEVQFYITLNLIFALGCRTNPLWSPYERISKSERFFARTQHPRRFETLNYGSLELVQSMLLMGQYLQSTERSAKCWNVIGLAIRVAQGIGLHLDLPATTKCSQLEVEMRKRVWWGCVILDRELSMTYGRPFMVHPIMNRGIRDPSITDDQFLSDRNGHENEFTPPEGSGVLMAFFVHALKLSDILCEILIKLYYQNCSQQREKSASDKPETAVDGIVGSESQSLLLLDSSLNRWLNSVPPYLRIGSDGDEQSNGGLAGQGMLSDRDATTKAILNRQANILHAQYLHVRILLLRPLLLELFDKEHALHDVSQDSSLLNTIIQRTMLTNISNICVSTAQRQIDHILVNVTGGGSEIHAWWYNVYYIYTCATVILIGRLCPSIEGLAGKDSLVKSWEKVLECLKSYCVFSQPAQKGFKGLNMIDQRLFKTKSTRPNGSPTKIGSSDTIMSPAFNHNRPDPNMLAMIENGRDIGSVPAYGLGESLESPGTGGTGRDIDHNANSNGENSGIDLDMDLNWNRDDLQLEWLNSMPFVEEFMDDALGLDYGGGLL